MFRAQGLGFRFCVFWRKVWVSEGLRFGVYCLFFFGLGFGFLRVSGWGSQGGGSLCSDAGNRVGRMLCAQSRGPIYISPSAL